MKTIELAYQPFLQNASPSRSGNIWPWLLIGLALIGAAIAYASYNDAQALAPPETPAAGD